MSLLFLCIPFLKCSTSNGVGRTGAFIAMDMALEQSRKQGAIDVPAIVADIRNQRMKMIQTLVNIGHYCNSLSWLNLFH